MTIGAGPVVPTVSVLVTVYNRERYLAECLESVLSSTWTDMEVIVVDDASTDSSVSIAQGFADRDCRLRIIRNERNLGDYGNRTRAAQLARGKYLKYVDSDDLIYSDSLKLMVNAMEANESAALGLSHSLPEEDQPYPWYLTPRDTWRKEFLGAGCIACGPSGAIIRRDKFFEVGGFRNWGVLSDTDLWYRLSARWPLVLLPPGLVWWRRHTGQEYTLDGAASFYLENGLNLSLDALNSAECPLTREDREAARKRVKQHHARRLLSLAIMRRQPRLAIELLRKSRLSAHELLSGLAGYR